MSSDKVTRSLRLTPDLNKRLLALCEHIGTNPNAYLISEVGKCISRDELTFISQKNNSEMYEQILPAMAEFQQKLIETLSDEKEGEG